MSEMKSVLKLCIQTRLLLLLISTGSNYIIPNHIASDALIFPCSSDVLKPFTRWDSAWFLHIVKYGYPSSSLYPNSAALLQNAEFYEEQAHAFFPLFPWLIRLTYSAVKRFFDLDAESTMVISGLLVSNIFFVLSAFSLATLAAQLGLKKRHVWLGIVSFCFSPASIFFVSCYSESLYSFFLFGGISIFAMSHRLSYGSKRSFLQWISCFLLFCASLTRSNGILNSFVFGGGKLISIFQIRRLTKRKIISFLIITFVQIFIIILPYIMIQVYAYQKFCTVTNCSLRNYLYPWCGEYTSIYSSIQQRYWNVGFLKYFKVKNSPQFILAYPLVYFSIMGIVTFGKRPLMELKKLYNSGKKLSFNEYFWILLLIHWFILLIISLFIANIQISTRLLSASCPQLHWYAGQQLDQRVKLKYSLVAWWLVSYIIIGSMTHSNNYPWT